MNVPFNFIYFLIQKLFLASELLSVRFYLLGRFLSMLGVNDYFGPVQPVYDFMKCAAK